MSAQGEVSPAPSRRPGLRPVRLARVAGVPVLLSPSWLLIAALVTLLFAPTAAEATGLAPGLQAYLVAFALAVSLAVSVLAHEAAHAVAARGFGLPVERVVVDLWGGHTSLGRPQTPGASAVISVVGPSVNVALAVLAEVVRRQLPPALEPGSAAAVVAFLLLGTAVTNALVGVFNLVPGLPLDGGRVLEALVWRVTGDQDTGSLVAGWGGRLVAVAVVLYVAAPALVQGRLPSTVGLVWAALIGWFLWRGATASITVARFRRRAAGVDLPSVTRSAGVAHVGASVADLAELLRTAPVGSGTAGDVVLVDDHGRPVAVAAGGSVAAVPDHLRTTTPATAVARSLGPASVVAASTGSLGAVEGLARSGDLGIVLVDDLGRPAGRVHPDEFAAAMGLT